VFSQERKRRDETERKSRALIMNSTAEKEAKERSGMKESNVKELE
jgi:hypothetical protein